MPNKSNHANLVTLEAEVASVDCWWFLGVSGAVTATGFFVNRQGLRTGNAFSTSIAQGNGTNDPVQLSTSIPSDAVGAVVRFNGDVYFDVSGGSAFSTDFESNYARYPRYGAGANVAVGRTGTGGF